MCIAVLIIIIFLTVHMIILHIAEISQKLSKCSIVLNQLIVSAPLSDLPIRHYHYLVTLREELNSVGHQHSGLCEWITQ